MDDDQRSLETALEHTEADAHEALAVAKRLQATVAAAQKAAAGGDLRALRRSIEAAEDLVGDVAERVNQMSEGWPFSEEDEVALFTSGAYTRELLDAADRIGLRLYEQEGVLASYPSLVRLVPPQAQVTIDRKRHPQVRPSRLAEHLRALQAKDPRLKEDRFMETLFSAYELVTAGRGGTARLVDLHRALTLLPSAKADYGPQEFARDVYILDASGLQETRKGKRMRLQAGATGARDRRNLLVVVTREGVEKTYYGVEFA
jgi:hypothetical protein